MKIVVVCVEELSGRPPVIQLVRTLLELGHHVELIGRGVFCLPTDMKNDSSLSTVELGKKSDSPIRIFHALRDRKIIRGLLDRDNDVDLVWAATDISVRECSSSLQHHKFVAQLPELVEFVPFLRIGPLFLKDSRVPRIVKKASCVVVPEYNRAHIQRIWWGLPELPTVLPNKSALPNECMPLNADFASIVDKFTREEKRILLYQGGFTSDRDLTPIVESIKLLDGKYALYIMGPINNEEEQRRVDGWCAMSPDVHYVGFVNPPDHLHFTGYGHIGLLPYTPSLDKTRASSLNALYCAPNKIWEYSRAGLPMLGSDVPGLSSLFASNRLGLTADLNNAADIAGAILRIEESYEEYSNNNMRFYQSVDVKQIVMSILEKCV